MLCAHLNGKQVQERGDICIHIVDFLVVQTVNNLPAMQEMLVQSLGWEDPLDKGMETHSSILAWNIPWTRRPGVLQFMGSQRVGHH